MSDADPTLSRATVFYGQVADSVARIYVRAPQPEEPGSWTLSGRIMGPRCTRSTTLTTTGRLVDLGDGDSLLAGGVLPDPCFWSPELPNLYDVAIQLSRDGEPYAGQEQCFGIQPVGVEGQAFYLAGKRWVLRGVRWPEEQLGELDDWRRLAADLVIRNPSEELCRQASEVGVRVIADVCPAASQAAVWEAELRRLARWPCVTLAILGEEMSATESLDASPERQIREWSPNLMLASRAAAGVAQKPAWADLLVVEHRGAFSESATNAFAAGEEPLLVFGPPASFSSPADARQAVDRLQRDLAPIGQFAGYVV